MISVEEFDRAMTLKGFAVFDQVIADSFVKDLILDTEEVLQVCQDYRRKNGVEIGMQGVAHHFLHLGDNFLTLLERYSFESYIGRYLEGKYILDTFTAVNNVPGQPSYTSEIHRDSRRLPRELQVNSPPLMMNMLVMLDDFTKENGATYFLENSHRDDGSPTSEEFYKSAIQLEGKSGTVVLFDSSLWHCAGVNKTLDDRKALALMFIRPFMKPQFDYARALGYERSTEFSTYLRQVIGYNARIPSTLDEWYQPPNNRMYQKDQNE